MFVVFTDVFLEADESFSSVEGLWALGSHRVFRFLGRLDVYFDLTAR